MTNFVIKNASISGASLGCQAEIGTASAIASGALCFIHDLSFYQIEYASELALEHFLGLTCDPVMDMFRFLVLKEMELER